ELAPHLVLGAVRLLFAGCHEVTSSSTASPPKPGMLAGTEPDHSAQASRRSAPPCPGRLGKQSRTGCRLRPGPRDVGMTARTDNTPEGTTMAQYMILIYEDETAYANIAPEDWQKLGAEHTRFAEQLGDRMLAGNALQPTATATTIRGDVVTDGPFVETKEVFGGDYLIEAKDLDEALEYGKLCPAPPGGGGV